MVAAGRYGVRRRGGAGRRPAGLARGGSTGLPGRTPDRRTPFWRPSWPGRCGGWSGTGRPRNSSRKTGAVSGKMTGMTRRKFLAAPALAAPAPPLPPHPSGSAATSSACARRAGPRFNCSTTARGSRSKWCTSARSASWAAWKGQPEAGAGARRKAGDRGGVGDAVDLPHLEDVRALRGHRRAAAHPHDRGGQNRRLADRRAASSAAGRPRRAHPHRGAHREHRQGAAGGARRASSTTASRWPSKTMPATCRHAS